MKNVEQKYEKTRGLGINHTQAQLDPYDDYGRQSYDVYTPTSSTTL